jgi:hypothetical protein
VRLLSLALALAACHSPPPPQPAGVTVRIALPAPTGPANGVTISAAQLELVTVSAVSDRAVADPRATMTAVEVALGATVDRSLPSAPPGLYSAVELTAGQGLTVGADVAGYWMGQAVHGTVSSGPFDVGCATPIAVEPGTSALLSLGADTASWFAGIDLSLSKTDADDQGILLSDDDNVGLAAVLLSNVVSSFHLDCAKIAH